MKLILLLVLVVVLSACAPGVYVLEWNTPSERAPRERTIVERVIEREIEREVPVDHPTPPVTIPRDPVPLPPVTPPSPPPVGPPEREGRIKDMPPQSPWQQLIKRPGEPARLTPRP